jgi:putative acetyltransferase
MKERDMPPDQTLLERQPPQPTTARDLVIRATRVSDAEGLHALRDLPGYRFGTLSVPFQTLEETRRFIESRPAGHVAIVALLRDKIVGAAGFERYQGRRHHAAYLGMGVHDDHVGQGIGTALLRALIDTADNWLGIRRMELTVYTDNAPAIALYRRHGFEVEGTLSSFALRDGQFVDALTMARLR